MGKRIFGWVGLVLLGWGAVSCNDPSPLTLDGVPIGELVTDTIYLEAFSAAEIRYRTDITGVRINDNGIVTPVFLLGESFPGGAPIGLLRDPDFGTVTASTYMEFVPDNFFLLRDAEEDSARNFVVDSVTFQIRLLTRFDQLGNPGGIAIEGDTSAEVQVFVYPLLDTLQNPQFIQSSQSTAGHYYTDSIPTDNSHNQVLTGPVKFVEENITELRLQLRTQTFQNLFDLGLSNISLNDSLFRINFPGLYITHRPTGNSDILNSPGSIWFIDLLNKNSLEEFDSLNTRLEVNVSYEYKSQDGTFRDTTVRFLFVPELSSQEAERYLPQRYYTYQRFDVAGKAAEQALANAQTPNAQQLFFQGANGAVIRLRLPERENLPFFQDGEPIPSITSARLLLDLDTTFYTDENIDRFFTRPGGFGQLELYETTPGTDTENLWAGLVGSFFTSDPADADRSLYEVTVTDRFQNFVFGINDIRDFTLVRFGKFQTLRRGVFIGPGHPDTLRRPRLIVTYNRPPSALSGN